MKDSRGHNWIAIGEILARDLDGFDYVVWQCKGCKSIVDVPICSTNPLSTIECTIIDEEYGDLDCQILSLTRMLES